MNNNLLFISRDKAATDFRLLTFQLPIEISLNNLKNFAEKLPQMQPTPISKGMIPSGNSLIGSDLTLTRFPEFIYIQSTNIHTIIDVATLLSEDE